MCGGRGEHSRTEREGTALAKRSVTGRSYGGFSHCSSHPPYLGFPLSISDLLRTQSVFLRWHVISTASTTLRRS